MKTIYADICSDALTESRDFYVSLFQFKPVFDVDWYVHLQSANDPQQQLAFVRRDHSSVPSAFRQSPRGVVVTVEVDAVDAVYREAKRRDLKIVQELRDEEFGQRHFMTIDPNGLLVDVVQTIPFAADFARRYGLST